MVEISHPYTLLDFLDPTTFPPQGWQKTVKEAVDYFNSGLEGARIIEQIAAFLIGSEKSSEEEINFGNNGIGVWTEINTTIRPENLAGFSSDVALADPQDRVELVNKWQEFLNSFLEGPRIFLEDEELAALRNFLTVQAKKSWQEPFLVRQT